MLGNVKQRRCSVTLIFVGILVSCAEVRPPISAQDGLQKYETTLLLDFRAFAFNPSTGRWGRSWYSQSPKKAIDEAMSFCERTGEKCTLYALGDTIVSDMSSEEIANVAEKYYFTVSPLMARASEDQLVGNRLSAEEITAYLSEKMVLARNFNAMEYKIVWKSDGHMTGEAVVLHNIERVRTDAGTWAVQDGYLCRQWQRWSGGRRECLMVYKDGRTLRAYDIHGDVIELMTLSDQ